MLVQETVTCIHVSESLAIRGKTVGAHVIVRGMRNALSGLLIDASNKMPIMSVYG